MITIAFCGLECSTCPTFIATQTNDAALAEKTAREWSLQFAQYTGRNDLRAEEMICDGCWAEDSRVFIGCRHCEMRKCARGKQFATCADCAEMGSCAMLVGFHNEVPEAKERLLSLRRGGDG